MSHDDVIKWKHVLRYWPFVTGGFPSQRPVTRSFDVFLDVHPNKRLSIKSTHQWFEMPLCSLWRHCNLNAWLRMTCNDCPVIASLSCDVNVLLTHWGRMTHICVSKQIIIGSDNGLSPGRRQTIIWTNAGKLLFGSPGTNFSEILIEIHTLSFKKMRLKVLSAKRRPFCLGLNVFTGLSEN